MEQSTSKQSYISPYLSDPQFQQGLESILAPLKSRNATGEEIEEVTKRAETFFAQSRIPTTFNSGDITNLPMSRSQEPQESSTTLLTSSTISSTTSTPSDAPPYPLSFATLASLIASGAPIPGIREIPNKLASEEPSISTIEVGKVKKPWER